MTAMLNDITGSPAALFVYVSHNIHIIQSIYLRKKSYKILQHKAMEGGWGGSNHTPLSLVPK